MKKIIAIAAITCMGLCLSTAANASFPGRATLTSETKGGKTFYHLHCSNEIVFVCFTDNGGTITVTGSSKKFRRADPNAQQQPPPPPENGAIMVLEEVEEQG